MGNRIRVTLVTSPSEYNIDLEPVEDGMFGYPPITLNVMVECDEVGAVIGYISPGEKFMTLLEIAGPLHLLNSIEEMCSEYQADILRSVLECNDYQYTICGEILCTCGVLDAAFYSKYKVKLKKKIG